MAEHKPQRSRVEWVQAGGSRSTRRPERPRPRREGRVTRLLHRRLSARQALLLCLVLATITGLVALSARAARRSHDEQLLRQHMQKWANAPVPED